MKDIHDLARRDPYLFILNIISVSPIESDFLNIFKDLSL
jgi:hypothetical protein